MRQNLTLSAAIIVMDRDTDPSADRPSDHRVFEDPSTGRR